jgi:hypothetical protein
VLAIWSHRPSRLSCLLGFGAALVLAGSTLALAPAPARASSGDHLYVIQDDGQFARSGTSYQISVYASSDSINPDYCFGDKVHFSYPDCAASRLHIHNGPAVHGLRGRGMA